MALVVTIVLVAACGTTPTSSSTLPARPTATSSVAEQTTTPSPTPATSAANSPRPSRAPEPTALAGLPVDSKRVLAAANSGCTGGPVGGEATETTTYDFWTLHCPAGDTAQTKLVAAFRAELERLGVQPFDEGEVGSGNVGNSGDRQVSLHGQGQGIDITVRVTALKAPNQSAIVITIDQRRL